MSTTSDQAILDWANRVYLVSITAAAFIGSIGIGASFFIYRYANKVSIAQSFQIQQLERDRDVAKAATASANERVAGLEVEATKAKLELARIVNPRTVTPEQVQQLQALLKDAPRGPLIVESGLTDGEARRFANRLVQVFKDLGYSAETRPPHLDTPFNYDIAAVAFEVHDIRQVPEFARRLVLALQELGFPVGIRLIPQRQPGEVWVMVGPRF